ncbi:MAG TPA: CotH kinase family protein [Bacteroidales bacterium]|nr:CotH kinase family protein [Bacteroidales bacterium]
MKKFFIILICILSIGFNQAQNTVNVNFSTDFTETNITLIVGNEGLDSVMSLISHRGIYLVYGKHSSFGAGTLVPMSRVSNTYSFSAPSVTLDKNTLYEYYFQVGTDGYFAEGNVGDIARLAPGFYRFLFTNTSDTVINIPALTFNGNGPAGHQVIRVKLNMSNTTPAANGVFVKSGNTIVPLYDTNLDTYDDDNQVIYEGILYAPSNTELTYTFYNGIAPSYNLVDNNTYTVDAISDIEVTPVSFSNEGIYEAVNHDLYDPDYIQRIEITFTEPHWQDSLTVNKPLDIYMPATVSINGIVLDSVGVKYKGNSSYSPGRIKNPFNLSLDEFKSSNDYQDYTSIKLANVFGDPSFIREVLTYEIAGKYLYAPKANYAQVYINGNYIGLYSNTEAVNKSFCKRTYGSKNNTFMSCSPADEPTVASKSNLKYISNNYLDYESAYELKSSSGWNNFIALCDTVTNFPDSLGHVLDIDKFIWMCAFNNVLGNIDSYIGVYSQNYYLYRSVEGKFMAIPWDYNLSFGAFNNIGFEDRLKAISTTERQQLPLNVHSTDDYWPMLVNIYNNPRWLKMYLAHCKTIFEENFENDDYLVSAEFWQNKAIQSVGSDVNKFFSLSDFYNGFTADYAFNGYSINGIQTFLDGRSSYLSGITEFTNTQPELYDAARTYDNGARFTVKANDADHVYLFYRLKSDEHRSYTMVEMSLSGDQYGVTLPIYADTLDYYYYAENSTIGAFLPARANKEFYRIPVTPSMGVDQAIVDNNRVFYNKNTQSIKFVLAAETESIQIFSVSGQLLQTVYPSDLHFEVSTNQIAPQMVIVQMIQNNNIISKKIMII